MDDSNINRSRDSSKYCFISRNELWVNNNKLKKLTTLFYIPSI